MPEVHDIRISLLHVTGDIASCTDDKSIRGHEIFASVSTFWDHEMLNIWIFKELDNLLQNVEYAHGCFSAKLTYHVAKLLVSKVNIRGNFRRYFMNRWTEFYNRTNQRKRYNCLKDYQSEYMTQILEKKIQTFFTGLPFLILKILNILSWSLKLQICWNGC